MLTMLNNGEKIYMKDPVYISGFNPNGYNNQPSFINPRELYVTTDMYDKNFTDIVKLDLQNEEYYRVTATDSIAEYSPTPQAIRSYFSTVRVEKDGKTQSLWLYPKNHQSYGKRVLKDIGNVGYHCWLSEEEVALFLVDDPMQLAIGNIKEDVTQIVLENIGRCFRQNSDGDLLFIHKISPEKSYIKSYNAETNDFTSIAETLAGSEDFELLNDGTFIMGSGSQLYKLNPEIDNSWLEVIDLAEFEIMNITRLAASRNRLVLVNNPK
ncbi:MAG: hypothetical protein ACJATI_003966 [Halioglobus sp.]|jgi:hypothetical protein